MLATLVVLRDQYPMAMERFDIIMVICCVDIFRIIFAKERVSISRKMDHCTKVSLCMVRHVVLVYIWDQMDIAMKDNGETTNHQAKEKQSILIKPHIKDNFSKEKDMETVYSTKMAANLSDNSKMINLKERPYFLVITEKPIMVTGSKTWRTVLGNTNGLMVIDM